MNKAAPELTGTALKKVIDVVNYFKRAARHADGDVDFPQIVFEKGATERGFQG